MSGRIRAWWPLMVVAPFLVAALWLLYVVWRSSHRIDLATYGAFAAAVVTLIAGWVTWAWHASANPAGLDIAGRDLDRVADLLATAAKTQWEQAADERGLAAEPIPVTWGRPLLPLAGPITAAVGSRRFDPLPGVTPVRQAQFAGGQIDDLHAVYGGLRSGRVVIAGAPGSGKSSAAVLLILAALKHRARVRAVDRVEVPVPVLFTAQGWDPRRQPVREWLIGQLQQAYPLFAGRVGAARARGLIVAGKLTMILDGLDEISEELRPVALQALNQVSFRIVVLSRTAEIASAASRCGVLQSAAAVELRGIDAATAAGYLERVQLDPPPAGWHDMISRIRASPASPLAKALDNPLALTLVRDTYQSGDDVRELLDHCDAIQKQLSGAQAAEEITGHLLDRVLPSAYAARPGQPLPRYDLQTAMNALANIAARMSQEGTRDLRWWHIPQWAPSARRIIMAGLRVWFYVGVVTWLAVGLVTWLAIGGLSGLVGGLLGGIAAGLVVGLVAAVAAGVAARGTDDPPARIGRISRLRLRRVITGKSLKFGLLSGSVFGLVVMIAVAAAAESGALGVSGIGRNEVVAGLAAGAISGLEVGFVFGLVAGLAVGMADAFVDQDSTSSSSPTISWYNDRQHSVAIGLVVGLMVGLVAGMAVGLVKGVNYGPEYGLVVGLVVGLLMGLVAGIAAGLGISRAWPTSLAAGQLAKRWNTPLHLMDFLADAHKRNILRTVGPVYQFRHARLQDRLAAATTSGRNNRQARVLPSAVSGGAGRHARPNKYSNPVP